MGLWLLVQLQRAVVFLSEGELQAGVNLWLLFYTAHASRLHVRAFPHFKSDYYIIGTDSL